MSKLEDVSAAALRDALDRADDAKAAKRLMIAVAYVDGVDVAVLSERYGIPESTIYYWLGRFEDTAVEDAMTDDPRPGRPSKLAAEQRAAVERWLAATPRELGLDADEWTPELLRNHISDEFGVDYSRAHVQRILEDNYSRD